MALLIVVGGFVPPQVWAVPGGAEIPEAERLSPLEVPHDFNPSAYTVRDGQLVVSTDSAEVLLTLSAPLQREIEALLARYEVPAAGVVVMEPKTGKILAYVNHQSTSLVGVGDMVRSAEAPAASVFKIVTAAALIDKGVLPSTEICYGGGYHRLTGADLKDDPRRDRACATFSDAMGQSINTIFAKLAVRHLDAERLKRYASAFGFGHRLPFDVPLQPSAIDIPVEELEFARAAAGFWHTQLSPLHGALLAATVANQGRMPRAHIIQSVRYPCGEMAVLRDAAPFRAVISEDTARTLAQMMTRTVSKGTAFRAFHDSEGKPFLPGIDVAGKTGSLSASDPYRAYSWWVGFAPAEAPSYVISALIVNSPTWRIKASLVARESIRMAMQAQSGAALASANP
ncbi:MAG: penicillin-binding protein [Myxococcales bacterium]|nr:penicillin-binding protein [Myxococcales bacterium]